MKNLLVILGPTGVGKTELSLKLAECLNCSIISADSRQLYKNMVIGTAAPSKEQLSRVPHFLIGELEVDRYYSASEFENDALNIINKLHLKNDWALLVGGSMMYIDAICKGIDEVPTIDKKLREELYELYLKEGLDPIRLQLKVLDPIFYNQVDLKNHKRVIHALEVCLMAGKPYSSLRKNTTKKRPFNIIKIGLTRDREQLYQRINDRVDDMISNGLLEEAKYFLSQREFNSLNTVGYKELFNYFDGTWELDFAIEKIKQHSRIYSRKQLTWFKRDSEINWINLSEFTDKEALDKVKAILKNQF